MACIREHVRLCARCEGRYGELLSLDERMHGEFRNMLHNTQLPGGIRGAWRSQLDTESHQTRRGRSIPFRMARFMAVAAASVVILVLACGLSPTVTLYAGSLPGVGTLLSALGADRGLLMAQHQGLVADVNVSVDSSGVKMTVRKVVGDPTRVVAALELEGKGLAADKQRYRVAVNANRALVHHAHAQALRGGSGGSGREGDERSAGAARHG